jgi:hypothetical protein
MQYEILLNSYDKQGYIYEYRLNKNGDTKLDYQHRIKWELRYGIIPKEYEIHHINRNKKDNRLGKNLFVFMLKGYLVFKSGNLLCLPKHLHTELFHNINNAS